MTTSTSLVAGDLLTATDLVALLSTPTRKVSRSAAYAIIAEIGIDIPFVGLRVRRARLEAWLLEHEVPASAPAAAPAAAPAPTPPRPRKRRRRGTPPACSAPAPMVDGLTGPELMALHGVGRAARKGR